MVNTVTHPGAHLFRPPLDHWGPAVRQHLVQPTGEVRTNVVVRYPEDGIRDGHYVITQRDEPKRQVAEFCEAIANGQTPIIR